MTATTAHDHTAHDHTAHDHAARDYAAPDLEGAAERVRKANERLTDAGRKMTTVYLDGVERYVVSLADAERKLARQARFESVTDLLNAHANVTEEVVKAGVAATRGLIQP